MNDKFPPGRSGWGIGNQDHSKRGLGRTAKRMKKESKGGCLSVALLGLIPLVVIAECIWGSFFS